MAARQEEVERRLTVGEFRDAGLCVRGQRRFAEQHGLDFKAFVRDGISIEEAMKLNQATTELILARRKKAE